MINRRQVDKYLYKYQGTPNNVTSPSFIPDASLFVVLTKGTCRSEREPGRPAPATDLWGAAAPQFGSMADVAMEIWGKAAGGREAAVILFLCVVFVC